MKYEKCTDRIAISTEISGENHTLFMDPLDNIAHLHPGSDSCLEDIPFKANDTTYIYHPKSGSVTKLTKELPSLQLIKIDMASIRPTSFDKPVIHELIIHSFDEFRNRFSMNDILSDVANHEAVLQSLGGISSDPSKSAQNIQKRLEPIMRFPSLHGLKPSFGSLWQWFINLGVTILFIVLLVWLVKFVFRMAKSKIQSNKSTHIELDIETTKPRQTDNNTTNITINTTQEQRPLIENVTSNNQPDANPPPFNRLYPDLNTSVHNYDANTFRQMLNRITAAPVSDNRSGPTILPLAPLSMNDPRVKEACDNHKSMIDAKLGGRDIRMLFDSGASASVISKATADSYRLSVTPPPNDAELLPFSGPGITIVGECTSDLTINHTLLPKVRFIVVDNLHYTGVIGVDVFERLPGVSLSYEKGRLKVHIPCAPLMPVENDPVQVCEIKEQTVLPPKHRVYFEQPCDVDKPFMFEPINPHADVMFASTVNPGDGTARFHCINTGDETLVMDPGTPLGYISQLPDPVNIPTAAFDVNEKEIDQITEDPISEIDLSDSKVSANDKEKFLAMLRTKKDAFAKHAMDIGCVEGLTGEVCPTVDDIPIHKTPYKVAHSQKQIVEDLVKDMLKYGLIEKATNPVWTSPCVLAHKHTGGYRLCQDYRTLNAKTKTIAYPLPLQDSVRDILGGKSLFTTLDITKAYWQLKLDSESDRNKCSFVTSSGVYTSNRLCFGLKNAPAVWSRAIQCILQNLEYPEVFCFLDDILIASNSDINEHIKRVSAVLDRLIHYGIKINGAKSHWLQSKVIYLGHEYSKDGVKPSKANVEKFLAIEKPKDVKSLRRFLGAFNFYSVYIPRYAFYSRPLYDLLIEDNDWVWGPKQQKAFTHLRQKLTEAPCLIHPIWGERFHLFTDSSAHSLGAQLCQISPDDKLLHPVAFRSRTLTSAEMNYSVIEKEALAIVDSCEYWRAFLLGYPVTVYTDHRPLRWMLVSAPKNSRISAYALRLQEFQITLQYIKGSNNNVADLLSRDVNHTEYIGCSAIYYEANHNNDYVNLQTKDPLLKAIIEQLEKGIISDMTKESLSTDDLAYIKQYIDDFYLDNKVLHKLDRQTRRPMLVVPSALRNDIFMVYHHSLFGAHQGSKRTTDRIKQKYFWPAMDSDIKTKCQQCVPCSLRKGRTGNYPLTPIPCFAPFERVSVDVSGPMRTTTRGNTYLLAFTDSFTKWVILIPVANHDANTVCEALIDNVVLNFTTPKTILSDRGPEFISQLFTLLLEKLNMMQKLTTPYNPSCNGMSERFFQTSAALISALLQSYPEEWDTMAKYVAHAYNNTEHSVTKLSPKFLLHGSESELPYDMLWPRHAMVSYVDEPDIVDSLTARMHHAWWLAKDNIEQAQVAYKAFHDAKHTGSEYKESDIVYIRTPYRDSDLPNKFATRFSGPYVVIKTQGPVVTCKKVSEAGTPVGVPFIVNVRRLKKSVMPDDFSQVNQYKHQPRPTPRTRTPVPAPRNHTYNLRPRN